MDYIELIKQSLIRAWRYKFLWLFGFFVAAADWHGGFNMKKEDFENWHWLDDFGISQKLHFHIEPVFIAYIILLLFAIWVIFFVLSVLSEGALIFGVFKKEKNEPVDFGMCWSEGISKFLRLFVIIFFATAITVALIFGMILFMIPVYIMALPLGIILTLLMIPIIIVIVFITVCIKGWAIRYGVLHNMSWIESINRGWILFKKNVGRSIGVALSSFFTQFIIWCGLIIGLLLIGIPFFFIGTINLWAGILAGSGLILLILCFAEAFFGTFASTIWTLGFMKLTEVKQEAQSQSMS